jgi:hypothetical protein
MKKPRESVLADPVTHQEMQDELARLRSAVIFLANCVGAHILSQQDGKRLLELLAPPWERHEYEDRK